MTAVNVVHQVTSRLSAVDSLPVERLLGFGARFLQEDYSAWAQQQGGYVRNLSFFFLLNRIYIKIKLCKLTLNVLLPQEKVFHDDEVD